MIYADPTFYLKSIVFNKFPIVIAITHRVKSGTYSA
jgi:hypothetical protein